MRREERPEAPTIPLQITEPELVLLKHLQADVQYAQGVLQRYGQGLAQTYQLGPKDILDTNSGVITRQVLS